MKEELSLIEKNQTRKLMKRSEGTKVIGAKWIFKTKLNPDSSINSHNARLVTGGDVQNEGFVSLKYCNTDLQLVDKFTKGLPRSKFKFFREKLGVCSNQVKEEC